MSAKNFTALAPALAITLLLGAVQLMHRSTRKISLTEAGDNYLEDCLRILNDLANAEAAPLCCC